MAGDRVVKVQLTAQVNNYVAGMKQAAAAATYAGSEAEQAAKKLEAQRQAFTNIGGALVGVGAVAAAVFATAVSKFAEFDQAISSVKAATQETADNMDLLRDAALDAGGETVFTATEAANAIEEMGKAGVSTADILNGGLDGALSLAAAGQLDVARAAEVAAISMKQFGLEGKDIPHIADLLAAGAGKAAGDVEDLAQALNQSALVANQTGLSIEETTGTLAAFASAGLLGSDAGTSFKSMLQRLTPVSNESQKAMDELGISAYDAQGEFIGMEAFAGNLQASLKHLTVEQRNAAMAQIFGSDAVRAASVLYEQGAKGIGKWVNETNDAGYAAKVAADRLDNLAGDVEKLGGAFDTAFIKSGSTANDMLRGLTQTATFLIDGIAGLPAPVLGAGMAITGLTAVVGLAGGTALLAVPKFAEMKLAMQTLGITAKGTALSVGLIGGAVAVATVGIGFLVSEQARAAATAGELKDSFDEATGAITGYTRELIAKKLAESGAFDAAKEAGVSQKELTDAVIEGGDALDSIKQKLTDNNTIGTFFTGVGIRAGNATGTIRELSNGLEEAKGNFEDEAAAADTSAESTGTAAETYKEAADSAAELQSNLQTLIDTINEANGVGQDAVSTNASYQQALVDVDAAIRNIDPATGKAKEATEALAKSVDESTAAGAANADMFADLAAKSQEAATAQFELDGNTETYVANLEAGRQTLYDQILALTGNADAAQALTDKIYAMPTQKEIDIIADTSAAARTIDDFIAAQGRKVGTINFRSQLTDLNGAVSGSGRMGTFADGGAIRGPGGPRSDVIPVMVSNGEHILDAQDVARMGGQSGVYRFRESLYRGYADGGAIQYAPPSYASSGGSAGGVVNNNYISVPAVQTADPDVTATIVGREFARRLAG